MINLTKEKIVVTGGAGFIGSHLCETLIKTGKYDIYSIDNYFTGSKKNHIEGINYIDGLAKNISNLIDFKPKILFHFGEYSRVEQSFDDFEKVWEFNYESIKNVVKFSNINDCKLVYSGSSTKFGDNGQNRYASPYAWTKASNTDFIKNYSSWFNLNYVIVYFYNVYGGREIAEGKYSTVIAKFLKMRKKNQSLPIVLPGTQKRNFTHIDDVVNGILLAAFHGDGDGYGIGHDDSFSIKEVANMIGEDQTFLPERPGNRMEAYVKNEKVKALGWESKTSLQDYIKDKLDN